MSNMNGQGEVATKCFENLNLESFASLEDRFVSNFVLIFYLSTVLCLLCPLWLVNLP